MPFPIYTIIIDDEVFVGLTENFNTRLKRHKYACNHENVK